MLGLRALAVTATTALVVVIGAVVSSGIPALAEIGADRRFCVTVPVGEPGDLAVVNLTPIGASAPGNGQMISSDVADPPVASNVNFGPGTVDPNVAVAPIGTDGTVCFANSDNGTVDVIVDLLAVINADAYAAAPGGAPVRIVDTRSGHGGDRLAPGERRCFDTGAIPGDSAVVNLTPIAASGPGNGVLVSSDTTTPPTASSVNFTAGSVDPNVSIATVGADEQLCFANSDNADVDLIVDLLVTIDADAVTPTATGAPVRLVDTRSGLGGGRLAAGEIRCFDAAATSDSTAVVNLTPLGASGAGNGALTSSDDATAPSVSSVNFAPGTVDPNVAFATVGTDGRLCFHNSDNNAVDLVADLLTTIDAAAVVSNPAGPPLPRRLVDTRPERRDVVACPTELRCYAAGDQFYVSDDGGTTWRLSELALTDGSADSRYDLFSITCLGTTDLDHQVCHAFATGPLSFRSSNAWVTMDGGRNWRRPAAVNGVFDVGCPDAMTCIAVGHSINVGFFSTRRAAISNDAGTTWRSIALPSSTSPTGIERLSSISCLATSCTAVSVDGDTFPSVLTFDTSDGWDTVIVTETPI